MKVSAKLIQEYLINLDEPEVYLATYDDENHVEITNIVLKKALRNGISIRGEANRKKYGKCVPMESTQFDQVFHDLYIKDLNSKKNSYQWISKEKYEKLLRRKKS